MLPRAARCLAGWSSSRAHPALRHHAVRALSAGSKQPPDLSGSKYIDIVLDGRQLAPARDGGFLKAVGMGDRGAGLSYRAHGGRVGRLGAAAGTRVPDAPWKEPWIVKVLYNSDFMHCALKIIRPHLIVPTGSGAGTD